MTDGRDNAADPKETKRRKEREKNREKTRDNDLRHVCSSPQGRRFVWWLLEQGRVFGTCRGPDVFDSMRNEGRQDFGHQIMGEIVRVCPELYRKAMEEQEENERRGR